MQNKCRYVLNCFFLGNYLNPIRYRTPPPPTIKCCPHAFNSGATLLCVGDFSPKIALHCVAKKIELIRGQGLAVRGDL